MGSWMAAVAVRVIVWVSLFVLRVASVRVGTRLGFRPLLVVVCLGVVGVAPAIGAGQQQPRLPAGALSAADPNFGAGMKREKAKAERLRTPEARAERRRSRDRYRGLSAAAALDAGRAAFAEEFKGHLFDGAQPDPGVKVVRRLRNGAAVTQSASGEKTILQSSVPLETENAAGEQQPVDLSLAADGAGFRTRNALVDLRVAKRSRGGVAFSDGGFSVAPGGLSDAAATESADRVFFANTQPDADFVVAPRPAGAELAWQLRSPASPERLALDVELPAGAVLRRARTDDPIAGDLPSAFEIARGDEALGYVQSPNAYDADGVPVRSEAAIEGDSIVVSVKHRDGDYRYPLFVDPEVQVKDQHGSNWHGWGTVATPYNPTPNTRNYYGASAANCAYYCGLYLSMPTNHAYSWTGTSIHWQYRAIANTYIYAGTFGGMSHNPTVPFAAYGGPYTTYPYVFSRWYNGIFNGTFTNWEANTNYLNQGGGSGPNPFGPTWGGASGVTHAFCLTAPGPRCDRENTPASDHNALILGLSAQNDLNTADILTGNHRASVTMAWANTYLNDRYNPSMSSAKPADKGWTNDSATPLHLLGSVSAHDEGLGLGAITLTGAASGNGTLRPTCIGDPQRTPCPRDWSTSGFGYRLNEGINTLTLTPTDIVDNQGAAQTWTEKIDRTGPSSSASGELKDAAGGSLFKDGSVTITLSGLDPLSGVASLSLEDVGNGVVPGTTVPVAECTITQCPSSASPEVTIDASKLSPGTHQFRVTTTDRTGNQGYSAPWSVTVVERAEINACDVDAGSADTEDVDLTVPCSEDTEPISFEEGNSTRVASASAFAPLKDFLEAIPTANQPSGAASNARYDLTDSLGLGMEVLSVESLATPVAGPTCQFRYVGVYHITVPAPAPGKGSSFALRLAFSCDLLSWTFRRTLIEPGPSGKGASMGDIRRLTDGGFLIAYEQQTRDSSLTVVRNNVRILHYANLDDLVAGTITAQKTIPRRLAPYRPPRPSSEGTPNFRSIDWRGSLASSTITLGFHFQDEDTTSTGRDYVADREARGTLAEGTWTSVRVEKSLRQLLRSKGFIGNHGGRTDFNFGNQSWRIYEARTKTVDDDNVSWRLFLYKPASGGSPNTLTKLLPRTPNGSTSFANAKARLVPAPNGLANVLVVTTFVFPSRAGAGEGRELLYYFPDRA